MKPEFSVIIPVFNEAGLIGPTIEAVRASTDRPLEMIVVDDGSVDGCCAALEPADDLLVLRQPHEGAAAARNRGAALASAEVLLFIDAHSQPEPGWLEPMIPPLVYGDIITSAIGTWDGSAYGYGATLTSPKFEYRWLERRTPAEDPAIYPVPIAGSGSMLVRKDWYDYLGGFDTMRGLGAEDSELCVRCWSAGGSVRVAPDAKLVHYFKVNDTPGRERDGARYLYNIMRAAILHHEDSERRAIFRELRQWPDQCAQAESWLRDSDIWRRYHRFQQIKRRDLGWLCRRFEMSWNENARPGEGARPGGSPIKHGRCDLG